MHYQYRWIYAVIISILILMLAYFYDFQDQLRQVEKLSIDTKELTMTLAKVSQTMEETHMTTEPSTKTDLLAQLLAMAQSKGLVIQSVNTVPSSRVPDALQVHLKVRGDFQLVSAFVQALYAQKNAALMLDFSYQSTEHHEWLFTSDILILSAIDLLKSTPDLVVHNPFCQTVTLPPLTYDDSLAKLVATPLAQIKMVGYLREGERSSALVALPGGLLLDVYEGSRLGKEQGVVVEVKPDGMSVKTDKLQWIGREGSAVPAEGFLLPVGGRNPSDGAFIKL